MTAALGQNQTFFSEMTRTYHSIESKSFELEKEMKNHLKKKKKSLFAIDAKCQKIIIIFFLQKNVILYMYFYEYIKFLEFNSSKLNWFL